VFCYRIPRVYNVFQRAEGVCCWNACSVGEISIQ